MLFNDWLKYVVSPIPKPWTPSQLQFTFTEHKLNYRYLPHGSHPHTLAGFTLPSPSLRRHISNRPQPPTSLHPPPPSYATPHRLTASPSLILLGIFSIFPQFWLPFIFFCFKNFSECRIRVLNFWFLFPDRNFYFSNLSIFITLGFFFLAVC